MATSSDYRRHRSEIDSR